MISIQQCQIVNTCTMKSLIYLFSNVFNGREREKVKTTAMPVSRNSDSNYLPLHYFIQNALRVIYLV